MTNTPRGDALDHKHGEPFHFNEAGRDWRKLARELEAELNARKGDPVTRLHNLCRGLEEHRAESPYTAEALDLADASYKSLCAENAELRKKQGGLRVVEMQRALKPFAELAEIELLRWGAGLPKEDVYAGTQQVTVRMLVAARDALKDAPKIEPSEEGRQREDPLSPEAINRDSAPAPVVPAAVFYALLDWSGAEPSQSVLARAMDAWAAKCGDGCSGCPTCWGKSSTPPEIEQGHAPGVEMPAAAQALQIDLDAANDRLATSEARTFKYANWAGKVEGALRYVLLQDRCQRATELTDIGLSTAVNRAHTLLAQKDEELAAGSPSPVLCPGCGGTRIVNANVNDFGEAPKPCPVCRGDASAGRKP